MSFRLVPNSVTLADLERRNSPNRSVISPNFGDISLMAILAEITPSESVKMRRPALTSENLTNNQP